MDYFYASEMSVSLNFDLGLLEQTSVSLFVYNSVSPPEFKCLSVLGEGVDIRHGVDLNTAISR